MTALQQPVSQASTSRLKRRDKRRHFRVPVRLGGRFMFADADHSLRTVNVSCGGALLRVNKHPPIGTNIVCYFDDLGRLAATVTRQSEKHIAVRFDASAHKRDKLADRLMWLHNRGKYDLKDERSAPRKATNARAVITLADGRKLQCRVIDISLTGAAFEQDGPPLMVGEIVRAGHLKGEIVRSNTEGFAIRFLQHGEQ